MPPERAAEIGVRSTATPVSILRPPSSAPHLTVGQSGLLRVSLGAHITCKNSKRDTDFNTKGQMSAAVSSASESARLAANAARSRFAGGSLRPTRLPPRIKQRLLKDDRGLPIPHIKNLLVRDTHTCRLQDHYYNTLQDDLMYMTYTHEAGPRRPSRDIRLTYNPEDPYTKNRSNPPVGGSQIGKKPAPVCAPENVVRLDRIVLHIHVKETTSSKSALLPPMMALRAISGETEKGAGRHSKKGVELVRAVKTIGGWTRRGAPVGVKVELTGPKMYDFIGSLVEFVFPRLREFPGVVMPAGSANMQTPAGVSGVVAFGLPPEAMAFFPQIEVNVDSYLKLPGMHIHFITNAEGQGAQNKARALLSGYQIPFARK